MRFADFFARSFASVSAPQLPWVKMLKESPVAKIAVIPLCHISVSVYKTSVDWIALKSPETLANSVLWCLDDIIANLANQQSVTKGSKKSVQQIPSSNQNEEALSMNMDTNKLKSIKEADKCCKAVLGKITHHSGCQKGGAFVLLLAIGVYFAVFPSLELFDWEKLHVVFDSLQSS